MIYVAILGFGVVGSGVADVISMNERQLAGHLGTKIQVKKILDIRDFSDSPYASLFTKNVDEIFEDREISIVAETIGGVTIAYDFTKKALSRGKSVVTSNKELVAEHGVELMQLAAKNNCTYLFEASVGGGIPIIRPLHRCLAANRISKIVGIINGTTNYVLTQMQKGGQAFEEALSEAQQKGYAEQNPVADIEGHDARRKIAILASICLNGAFVDNHQIHTEGISSITQEDIAYATALGSKVKLLAIFRHPENEQNTAIVAPHIVSIEEPISVADGVFNAISVRGNAIGDVMFYGQGAGKMATASAVVGDILDAALHRDRSAHIATWYNSEKPTLSSHLQSKVKVLLRVAASTSDADIEDAFPNIFFERIDGIVDGEAGYIIGTDGLLTEESLATTLPKVKGLIHRVRIY